MKQAITSNSLTKMQSTFLLGACSADHQTNAEHSNSLGSMKKMVRIFSPERSELQNAFANQFQDIVRRNAKREALRAAVKLWMTRVVMIIIAIAFFSMLAFVWCGSNA